MPRRLPALALAATLVMVVVATVGTVIRQTQGGLGTASPPWVMDWGPRGEPGWLILAVLAGVLVVLLGPRVADLRSTLGALAGATALALLFALTVNAIRYGPEGWWRVFDLGPGGSPNAKNEYLPSLVALDDGVRTFLDRFAETVPALAPNAGAHPPGLLLTLHWLGIDSDRGMAALCIAAAIGCVPLTYALARAVAQTPLDARVAAVLCVACPVLVLYGTSSADAVFAFVGTLTAVLLLQARTALRVAGFLVLPVAALFSWALLAAAAFAAVVVWQREGLKAAAVLAAGCAAAFVAFYAALHGATGYDVLGVLTTTSDLYHNSVRTERPYWFWVLGAPTAWLTMLGPAIWLALFVAVQRARPEAVALAVVLVVASVAGFTIAETERIWLPFVPLACAAAAPILGRARLRPALAIGVTQTVLLGWLFGTVW